MSLNIVLSWKMDISKNIQGALWNFNFCAEMTFKKVNVPSRSLPVQMNFIGHVFEKL